MNIEARLRVRLRAHGYSIQEARQITRVVQNHFRKFKGEELTVNGIGVFKRTTISWKDSHFLVPEARLEGFIKGNTHFKNIPDNALIGSLTDEELSNDEAKVVDAEVKRVFSESLKEEGEAIFRSVFTIARTSPNAYAVYASESIPQPDACF